MKTIPLIILIALYMSSCQRIFPLDVSVKIATTNGIVPSSVMITNNSNYTMTDVLITLCPKDSEKEYFYTTDKIKAKDTKIFPSGVFKSGKYGTDNFNKYDMDKVKIKIHCNEGWWEGS